MTENSAQPFNWGAPQENWCKMPFTLIDAMPLMETEAEIKIVLYILRHTWGYQEYTSSKLISIDEFQRGRKRKDGTRIDNGTGMAKNSIKNGIRRAIEHGLIEVIEDNNDLARIKRYYRLSGSDQSDESGETRQSDGGQSLTPAGSKSDPQESKSDPQESKSDPRTKKDTLEKDTSEQQQPDPARVPPSDQPPESGRRGRRFSDSSFGEVCAAYESEIGTFTAMSAEELESLYDEHGKEWVIDAIRIAVTQNARRLSYVKSVLSNWKRDGRGGKLAKPATYPNGASRPATTADLTFKQWLLKTYQTDIVAAITRGTNKAEKELRNEYDQWRQSTLGITPAASRHPGQPGK